jgi:tRNA modification GTPase
MEKQRNADPAPLSIQGAGLDQDTIAAIATAPGAGGVGIIRLSGPASLDIAIAVCGTPPTPRYAHYRQFQHADGTVIDDGLCLYFPGPHSFTGEDVVELQGHGGIVVLQMLLERTLELGARQARPGEFSERAFLNGRLDLAQAEAIADLINAKTSAAARQAQATLRGTFSDAIDQLAQAMTALRVYVEAAIDFPEEEVDFLGDGQVTAKLDAIIAANETLLAEAKSGALMQTGANVVLAGKPNAGKSSLMNRLAEDEITIVTDIPGTTRDLVRETVQINGLATRLTDTAGLRNANNVVEQEGVRRATREIASADLVLYLLDDTAGEEDLPPATDAPIITVLTKTDLSGRSAGTIADNVVAISSTTGDGIEALKHTIAGALGLQQGEENRFSARERHLAALRDTLQLLNSSRETFLAAAAGELLAEDLRRAHLRLGDITGRVSSDELLGEIFSSFCIGK